MKVAALLVLAGSMVATSATGVWGWRSSAAGVFVIDRRGDVVTSGTRGAVTKLFYSRGMCGPNNPILKLSGRTGRLLWRNDLGGCASLLGLAVDPAGHLVLRATNVFDQYGTTKFRGDDGQDF